MYEEETSIGDIIYDVCSNFRPVRKKHRNYYLGNYFVENSYLLFDLSIPIEVYYNYPETDLYEYFVLYSSVCFSSVRTEIMQLVKVCFPVGRIGQFSLYTVVLKTFWIRILQRVWKKIFHQRRAARATIFAQNEFSVRGNWPRLPSYRGALAIACGVRAKI
jgi:hypothetical protein